jgi:hypothetical protein
MKEAQAVERIRVEQRVSYQDALKMVKQSSQKMCLATQRCLKFWYKFLSVFSISHSFC